MRRFPTAPGPPACEPARVDDSNALAILLRSGAPAPVLRTLLAARRPAALLALPDARLTAAGVDAPALALLRRPDPRQAALDARWLAQPRHRLVGWGDPDYPGLLRDAPNPPAALYVVGDVDLLWHPQVAVVGSRRPSAGGRDHAHHFARAFAAAGLAVCSGLAEGIDAEAHRGALAAGRTVAVLGTGPDRCFPAANAALMARIAEEGAIVTEHPPGTPGIASHFPSRNRIIAGLSLGTLVVEAALRSGALITARLAIEAGREAFALPGSIHNPMARGCHRLIREGAGLAESPQEVTAALAPVAERLAAMLRARLASGEPAAPDAAWAAERARRERPPAGRRDAPRERHLALPDTAAVDVSPERRLWQALGHDPVNLDQLCQRTGLTLGPLSAMLLAMELDGRITAEHGRYIRRS
jgi:DNA processing protein